MLLLLALACAEPPGPATSGSRSAELATRAGEVGRKANVLAERTRDLEGLFDELRAAPPEQRDAVRARIHQRAQELFAEAEGLQGEVARIETAAQVY